MKASICMAIESSLKVGCSLSLYRLFRVSLISPKLTNPTTLHKYKGKIFDFIKYQCYILFLYFDWLVVDRGLEPSFTLYPVCIVTQSSFRWEGKDTSAS